MPTELQLKLTSIILWRQLASHLRVMSTMVSASFIRSLVRPHFVRPVAMPCCGYLLHSCSRKPVYTRHSSWRVSLEVMHMLLLPALPKSYEVVVQHKPHRETKCRVTAHSTLQVHPITTCSHAWNEWLGWTGQWKLYENSLSCFHPNHAELYNYVEWRSMNEKQIYDML